MIVSRILNAYESGAFPPHPKADRFRKSVINAARTGYRVCLDEEVVELARTLSGPDLSDEALLASFRKVRLQGGTLWVEMTDALNGEVIPTALLMNMQEGTETLEIVAFPLIDDQVIEPLCAVHVDLKSGNILVREVIPLMELSRSRALDQGCPHHIVDAFVQRASADLSENALRLAKIAFEALNAELQADGSLIG